MSKLIPEPSDEEIIDRQSDENLLHMREREEVDYFLEWYFGSVEKTPSGLTAEDVAGMSTYRKIIVLEKIRDRGLNQPMPQGFFGEFLVFLESINKEGFMTADDIEYQNRNPLALARCPVCYQVGCLVSNDGKESCEYCCEKCHAIFNDPVIMEKWVEVECKCGKPFCVIERDEGLPSHFDMDDKFCTGSGCVGVVAIS